MAGVPDFAGFEDLVEIGRGGFGVVYRARLQPHRGGQGALGNSNEDARQGFACERRAMGSVSAHPNIVTIHASGQPAFLVPEDADPDILIDITVEYQVLGAAP